MNATHDIVNGQCSHCGRTHGDIVANNQPCEPTLPVDDRPHNHASEKKVESATIVVTGDKPTPTAKVANGEILVNATECEPVMHTNPFQVMFAAFNEQRSRVAKNVVVPRVQQQTAMRIARSQWRNAYNALTAIRRQFDHTGAADRFMRVRLWWLPSHVLTEILSRRKRQQPTEPLVPGPASSEIVATDCKLGGVWCLVRDDSYDVVGEGELIPIQEGHDQ